jgi:hypothetical protein
MQQKSNFIYGIRKGLWRTLEKKEKLATMEEGWKRGHNCLMSLTS